MFTEKYAENVPQKLVPHLYFILVNSMKNMLKEDYQKSS